MEEILSIKLIFRKLGSYFINPVISFIGNIIYWICNIGDLRKTIKEKNKIKHKLELANNAEIIQKLLRKFIWTEDKLIHWVPWVITFVHREFHDDCDGAAIFAKWMFKQINVRSKTYHLVSGDMKNGHLITITNDKSVMVSNNSLVQIPQDQNWKQFVLNWGWHKNIYKIIY